MERNTVEAQPREWSSHQLSLLCAGERYLEDGHHLVPLHGIRDGSCTCRKGKSCGHAGKHPVGRKREATRSVERLEVLVRKYPDMNLGLALDGLVVVDVDPRNGGSVPEGLPPSLTAHTGGGGLHVLFRLPDGAKVPGQLSVGVDLKTGAGQHIVVAPSRHKSGHPYVWVDDDVTIASAPEMLIKPPPGVRASGSRGATPKPPQTPPRRVMGARVTGYGRVALERSVERILSAQVGQRNDILLKQATEIFRLVATDHIPECDARGQLSEAAQAIGLEDEEIQPLLVRAERYGRDRPLTPRRPSVERDAALDEQLTAMLDLVWLADFGHKRAALRKVLFTLIWHCLDVGATEVHPGVRRLSEQANADPKTVTKWLGFLRSSERGVLHRTESDSVTEADLYRLDLAALERFLNAVGFPHDLRSSDPPTNGLLRVGTAARIREAMQHDAFAWRGFGPAGLAIWGVLLNQSVSSEAAIAVSTGYSPPTVRGRLAQLQKYGLASPDADGNWSLTPETVEDRHFVLGMAAFSLGTFGRQSTRSDDHLAARANWRERIRWRAEGSHFGPSQKPKEYVLKEPRSWRDRV